MRFHCHRPQNENSRKHRLRFIFGDVVSFERETEKAFGFRMNNQMVWLPKSQLSIIDHNEKEMTVMVPFWLIQEKNLEYFIDSSHEPGLFDNL